MAKTLDDLYSKLDEILGSLSSLNTSLSSSPSKSGESDDEKEKKAKLDKLEEEEKEKQRNVDYWKRRFDETINLIVKAHSSWEELEDQSYKTGRAMGYNAETINKFFHAQLENTKALATDLGITHQALDKLQASYSTATNRARTLTTEQMKFVGAMSKLVGEATVTEMIGNMDKFGASSQTAMARLAKARNEAAKFGLNANKTSEAIAKNIKLASSYNFKGGTSELAKMVIESEKMKVNFDSIAKASEKFTTLDSAISTSANIQVLGGSFAREFGNPLEVAYEATSDMKSFMERIGRTLEGKGIFNKKTGEVQFDPVTRRMLAEFGKQVGMSTEDLITMASSQITRTEIDNVVKGKNLGKEQLDFLKTSAEFDAETQKWMVNKINENGETEKVDITTLSNEDIKEIQRNTASEENAFKDIQSIRDHVAQLAKETSSFKEAKEGATSSLKAHVSGVYDWVGQGLKDVLQFGGGAAIATAWVANMFRKDITSKLYRERKEAITNEYKEKRNNPNNSSTTGSTSSGKGEPIDSKSTSDGKNFKKKRKIVKAKKSVKKLIGKAKGKGKLVVAAGALLATVFGLSAASNGTSQEANTQPNEVGSNGDPILDELKKHTELLSHMSEGIDKSREGEESEEGGYGVGSMAADLGIIALSTKTGQKVAGKITSKIAPKLATKLALGATTKTMAGPLGWAGLGVDVINAVGQNNGWWKEGGAVATTMDAAGGALTGAGIGSMILPGVGTAVGALVGGIIGASDGIKEGLQSWDRKTDELLDSDSIGDNILGGISWVGQRMVDNIGGSIARLFGETEYDRQEEAWEKHTKATREQQEAWESKKMEVTSMEDPQLKQKAAYATIKIHDQLITWYRAYMGLNSDATDDVGDLKKVEFQDIYRERKKAQASGEGFAEGGIVGGSSFSGDKLTAKVNSGEMILNANQQAKLFSLVAGGPMNTLIRAKEVVGQPQYISPSAPTPTINSIPQTTSVNVNVNGTLKLESNNNSLQIDLTQLLNNPQFKQQIVDMVTQGINERSNGAVRVNRDSPQAKSGGAIGKTAQINM